MPTDPGRGRSAPTWLSSALASRPSSNAVAFPRKSRRPRCDVGRKSAAFGTTRPHFDSFRAKVPRGGVGKTDTGQPIRVRAQSRPNPYPERGRPSGRSALPFPERGTRNCTGRHAGPSRALREILHSPTMKPRVLIGPAQLKALRTSTARSSPPRGSKPSIPFRNVQMPRRSFATSSPAAWPAWPGPSRTPRRSSPPPPPQGLQGDRPGRGRLRRRGHRRRHRPRRRGAQSPRGRTRTRSPSTPSC